MIEAMGPTPFNAFSDDSARAECTLTNNYLFIPFDFEVGIQVGIQVPGYLRKNTHRWVGIKSSIGGKL